MANLWAKWSVYDWARFMSAQNQFKSTCMGKGYKLRMDMSEKMAKLIDKGKTPKVLYVNPVEAYALDENLPNGQTLYLGYGLPFVTLELSRRIHIDDPTEQYEEWKFK